ncbi:SDR family oxidoreductase [Paeniglutamicibacter antarcticus]|uniref:dTDP-4-dehydrorhamnose reductase n=1 Tax=Paeniglutamicibacter antarcticus TaxID=494023 RepID=A0ABP9TMA3_9MICC
MRSILVIGAGGMAGHVISTYLKESGSFDVSTLSGHHRVSAETTLLDVTDNTKFTEYLDKGSFDVIINCIGSLVQASEDRKDRAVYLNAYLPHMLEQRYAETFTKIIHLSTDCVFSGENPPYREESVPDGALFYDRSKYLGELVNNKDLTFRMSIIGPDSQSNGLGLFNWFFAQHDRISGYIGAMWNGVTTITLAHAIHEAIEQDLTGLYHLVPKGNISKYELLKLFQRVFRRDDITVTPKDVASADKTLLSTRGDFDFTIPSYPEQIEEMRSWVEDHSAIYPHYSMP